MASMMRFQLYRLVRSRFFWVFLAVYAACIAVSIAMTLHLMGDEALVAEAAATSSDFARAIDAARAADALVVWGSVFANGDYIGMASGVLLGSLLAQDFKSGFAKNLVQARGGRAAYAASSVATVIIGTAAFLAVGVAVTCAGYALGGVAVLMPDAARAASWLAQVFACSAAYALIAAVFGIALGEAAALIAALAFGGYMVENMARMALAAIAGENAPWGHILDGSLSACMMELARGGVCGWQAYAAGLGTIAAMGAIIALIMRRKAL